MTDILINIFIIALAIGVSWFFYWIFLDKYFNSPEIEDCTDLGNDNK